MRRRPALRWPTVIRLIQKQQLNPIVLKIVSQLILEGFFFLFLNFFCNFFIFQLFISVELCNVCIYL